MTIAEQFRRVDTTKAPGVYVTFEREDAPDDFGYSYLADIGDGDETDDHRAETAARIHAFERGDWYYMGVRAVAHVQHVHSDGSSTLYTIKSAGLWGIESDSGESFLNDVFEDEKSELKATFTAMSAAVFE